MCQTENYSKFHLLNSILIYEYNVWIMNMYGMCKYMLYGIKISHIIIKRYTVTTIPATTSSHTCICCNMNIHICVCVQQSLRKK